MDAAARSATPAAPAPTHADLTSMREARDLVARAQVAQRQLAELSQAQIDAIVDAMAAAVTPQCEALAQLACEETGFGVAADKVRKNRFAAETVYQFIKPMKTVGVLRRIEATKVIEIAEPFGVVAAIIPTTNPTSTAIYKILIAIKARCAIVMSPHPSAIRCITRVAEIMEPAARAAGLPEGGIACLKTVTLEGTQELMRQKGVRVILATGGMGLVRAAYSAGKPAYGVGPGNAPAYIERTADVQKAVADILTGKTFDNGLLCSSENSVVVDEAIAAEAKAAVRGPGRLLPQPGRGGRARQGAGDAAAAAQPAGGGQAGDGRGGEGGDHRAAVDARAHRGPRGRRARLPALDRETVSGSVALRR